MTGAAEHHLHAELLDLIMGLLTGDGVQPEDQRWGFWPLLPLSSLLQE